MRSCTTPPPKRKSKAQPTADSPKSAPRLRAPRLRGAPMSGSASVRCRTVAAELWCLIADPVEQPEYHEAALYDWSHWGSPSEFVGLPMSANFVADCAVCGDHIGRGDSIFFNYNRPTNRRAAHAGCGRAVRRGEQL